MNARVDMTEMNLICYFLIIECIFSIGLSKQHNITLNNARNKHLINIKEEILNQPKEVITKQNTNAKRTLKYILFWTDHNLHPFSFFEEGWKTFFDKNCSITNCFVTFNKNYFKGDFTRFHAIVFNGRNIHSLKLKDLPKTRSHKQKYIYINYESPEYYPVCSNIYNDFFNWTLTYRLDSDIPSPYFKITNTEGAAIGPKRNMDWNTTFSIDHSNDFKRHNKSKAVAWFVSNCQSRSRRERYARELKDLLYYYGASLDIYGSCGSYKCPRKNKKHCEAILNKDYYFYLSFENSLSEDYVTEKVTTPLRNNVVPIVFGGADYKRFLSPGSYLDARNMSPTKLASKIINIIRSPELYSQFFQWQSHYRYFDFNSQDIVCKMCEVLNNQTFYDEESVYKNFRNWWHPNPERRCRE